MSATILYIPHGGGPLPLLGHPGHAELVRFLQEYPETIATPDAIVVVSAHWEEPAVSITAGSSPPLLFDYYGFPPETYEYEYPAPGHPDLAQRVRDLLGNAGLESRLDPARGYDHGVFVPLMLMYPKADIPCIQVSLVSNLDAALHVRLGQALRELRTESILILGSGLSFHNMQAIKSMVEGAVDDRNREFESWLITTCSDQNLDEADRERLLIEWESAPHGRYCHPREEHLLPLQVCYGIAGRAANVVFQDRVVGFLTSAYEWRI